MAPRSLRRLRRWVRTTPNTEIGATLLGIGALLVLVAALMIGVGNHWI